MQKIFRLTPFRLSLLLVIALVIVYVTGPRFLEVIELKAGDLRFVIRGPIEPGPDIVIAAIDEKSVDEIGRWPWPRTRIAEMIKALNDDGAKVIAFDIGFFEPDANTNILFIDQFEQEIKRLGLEAPELKTLMDRERVLADNDRALAAEIKKSETPSILGFFFHMIQDESVAHIKPEQVEEKIESLTNSHFSFVRLADNNVDPDRGMFTTAFIPESNIPILHEVASAAGFFNMFPDADGTIRWVPMAIKCRDKFFMPLSLQALRFALGDVPTSLTVSEIGVEKVSIGDFSLPTDETGRLLVNYRGPAQTFPHYSISDILTGSLEKGTFKDKIVLVGATAVGIYDLRVTPFDSVFPGIEIHANVIDNILKQDFLVRPGWAALLDLLSIMILGLMLGFVLPRLSALYGLLVGLMITAAWCVGNYYLFASGTWLNITYPLMTILTVYTAVTVFRYMTEEREKKKIRGAFSYYVNPSVVTEMLKNPDMLKLGGDKRIMTVLFSDIRGFTTISEKLDPEALVALLNKYLTAMTDLVFKYDGLVDKYIGDALMAVWGAPLAQPDHAIQACRSALEMMEELARLRQKWVQEDPNIPYIDIGIGLNSGPMVVGNMGSESRFDYTVMGDAVNLGSRLEGANKQYGTNILIGEITYEQIKEEMYCRELDSVAVKGKELPVRVYELIGIRGRVPEETLKKARAFDRGLRAYKKMNWDEAWKVFSAIHQTYPDDEPTRLYLDRIRELRQNPPPKDWNGVFVMKTK